MAKKTITGGCFCGRITFQAKGSPLWVAHCHCNSCRSSTGAPVTTSVGFKLAQVTFDGNRKCYRSSPGVRCRFCGHCGTPISYEADSCADEIHFYISVMSDPAAFKPERHDFYDERIPWLELHDDLPRHAADADDSAISWGQKIPDAN